MTSKRSHLAAPMVIRDIPAYRSPIDGKEISSRSARREDLKKNDCVEWEPGMGGKFKRTPGEYKNPRFAMKHGVPLREDVSEQLRKKGR